MHWVSLYSFFRKAKDFLSEKGVFANISDEPSHEKNFDTHAHDYNFATRRKLQNWFFSELHLTYLIKL